jgi:hypothetical protein
MIGAVLSPPPVFLGMRCCMTGPSQPETSLCSGQKRKSSRPLSRAALVKRIERTIARKIDAIDARMEALVKSDEDKTPLLQGDDEKAARTLALLAKTLRELADMPSDVNKNAARCEAMDGSDTPPRSLTALRDELARRLARLQEERAAD